MRQEFCKSDLRSGHIVTLENGEEYIVIQGMEYETIERGVLRETCRRDVLFDATSKKIIKLDDYDEKTLNHKVSDELKIVKVEQMWNSEFVIWNSEFAPIAIWKREPSKRKTSVALEMEIEDKRVDLEMLSLAITDYLSIFGSGMSYQVMPCGRGLVFTGRGFLPPDESNEIHLSNILTRAGWVFPIKTIKEEIENVY